MKKKIKEGGGRRMRNVVEEEKEVRERVRRRGVDEDEAE